MTSILSLIFATTLAHGIVDGDKIGNGGGLWACEKGKVIQTLQLVDFYEAESEWEWKLKAWPKQSYQLILNEIQKDLIRTFPRHAAEWNSALNWVMARANPVDVKLERIDDALFRSSPPARLCEGGKWNYRQWANFTEFNYILIQEDLWNHPEVSEVEKAGLHVHEAIYYWLRETYGEKTSERARYIVGLIFSDMNVEVKNSLLNEVLKQKNPPEPQPKPPKDEWLCTTRNLVTFQIFGAYSNTAQKARNKVLSNCKSEAEGYHCDEFRVACEKFQEPRPHWNCVSRNLITRLEFLGEGFSQLEARYRSLKTCVEGDPSEAFHCWSQEPVCEQE